MLIGNMQDFCDALFIFFLIYLKISINFTLYTDNRLFTVTFWHYDVGKIIQNLNPNKPHGHDNISIRMLKICDSSIYKPLYFIFKETLSTGLFSSNWKKRTLLLSTKMVRNKSWKTTVQFHYFQYVGNSLKDSFSMNRFLNCLLENNLISPNQFGFKPGDSSINQLLFITHEVYNSFDERLEVRSFFLDNSKAFDKVWHKVLFLKLSQNGISRDLLDLLSSFFEW